jgi:hypothetical protein
MPKPGQRGRRCVDPEDAADTSGNDLFMALTTHGICKISDGVVQRGITIWTLRDNYENAQIFFKTHRSSQVARKRKRRGR